MRLLWTLLACVVMAQSAMAQGNSDKTVSLSVSGGTISVNPDPAKVTKNQNKIVWTLTTAGYTFASNGIVIAGAGTEYGDCGKQGNSTTVYTCKKLKHVDGKRYKYDINLLNASGQAVKLDPFIVND